MYIVLNFLLLNGIIYKCKKLNTSPNFYCIQLPMNFNNYKTFKTCDCAFFLTIFFC